MLLARRLAPESLPWQQMRMQTVFCQEMAFSCFFLVAVFNFCILQISEPE